MRWFLQKTLKFFTSFKNSYSIKENECIALMNINALRNKICEALETRQLNCNLVEKQAGIPRAALRNFVNGTVKGPKIEMIMAAAHFLEIDLSDIPDHDKNTDTNQYTNEADGISKGKDIIPTETNFELLRECLNALSKSLEQKKRSHTLDQSITLLLKIYNFCYTYNNQQLDESFVEWSIDNT